ncbi:MAG: hypothetical protein OJF49_000222 [Ktedonobacterales bacterium]|nr:MAG: hypothetical protein OJF49_000222 [Ktedonobacterales bacterium]
MPEVGVREVWQRMAEAGVDGIKPALIDVREVWEYAAGHAAEAVNIPLSELQMRVGETPKDRDVFFICHVGERSMMAARFAQRQGVTQVFNVEGGTDAWEAAGLPMERASSPA